MKTKVFDISQGDCRNYEVSGDNDPWYAPRWSNDAAKAKTICRGCPIKNDCAEYALRKGIPSGIWGGLDEYDRKAAWDGNRPTDFDDEVDAAIASVFANYYYRLEGVA